jgi:hypothetical protein
MYETSYFALRKGHALRVLENKGLKETLERKRLTGGCTKLHSEELHNFQTSRNIKLRCILGNFSSINLKKATFQKLVVLPTSCETMNLICCKQLILILEKTFNFDY